MGEKRKWTAKDYLPLAHYTFPSRDGRERVMNQFVNSGPGSKTVHMNRGHELFRDS